MTFSRINLDFNFPFKYFVNFPLKYFVNFLKQISENFVLVYLERFLDYTQIRIFTMPDLSSFQLQI